MPNEEDVNLELRERFEGLFRLSIRTGSESSYFGLKVFGKFWRPFHLVQVSFLNLLFSALYGGHVSTHLGA